MEKIDFKMEKIDLNKNIDIKNKNQRSISMENIITYIRNVLRKEGITGMESVSHCIVFVVFRMMTEELCDSVEMDTSLAFENAIHDEDGEELGAQELYDKFYYKGNKQLNFVGEFVNKLNFSNFKFKLEGIHNLESIVNKLRELDVADLATTYDLIGTIYELHLKSGTSRGAMRDLGQYYTHRLVIKYMIELCDPTVKNGVVEKIVDPTMGTGGFLTMAIKYLNNKYTGKKAINWEKNKDNIIGFDIDDNVKNMALLNVFLEIHHLCKDTIVKQDTLHNDLRFPMSGEILDKADVILANEPMGLKNIVHANCCERIKELKIRGTKAEPLFLQLFMEALNDGGRCAVIVPDGVLFNEAAQHQGTRKYLVENFNLKKVVTLKGDFFLNTGVKTSILFFAKEEKKTKEVDFCEISIKDDAIEETSIIKVLYKDIKANKYSLFVNKYNAEKDEKIEGIEYKQIKDLCEFLKKSNRKASYGSEIGAYPFYTSSANVKLCDDADYNEKSIIIGTGGVANIKYDEHFSCSSDNIVLKSDVHNIKYIFWYLQNNIDKLENGFVGSTIKHISKTYISEIEIPLPSLKVQEAIVERLNLLSENNKTMELNIEQLKKTLKYYVDASTRNEQSQKIGNICETQSGEYIKKNEMINGVYPVYGGGDASNYINKKNREDAFVIAKDGVSENCVRYISGDFFLNHHGWTLKYKKKNILNKYVYYWLWSNQTILYNLAHGSAQKGINQSSFYDVDILMPPKEKQQEIVDYCDNLMDIIQKQEKQIGANKELMKQIMDLYLNSEKNKEEQQSDNENEESEDIASTKSVKKQKSIKGTFKKTMKKTDTDQSESDQGNERNEEIEDEPKKKKVSKKSPIKAKRISDETENDSENSFEISESKVVSKTTAKDIKRVVRAAVKSK